MKTPLSSPWRSGSTIKTSFILSDSLIVGTRAAYNGLRQGRDFGCSRDIGGHNGASPGTRRHLLPRHRGPQRGGPPAHVVICSRDIGGHNGAVPRHAPFVACTLNRKSNKTFYRRGRGVERCTRRRLRGGGLVRLSTVLRPPARPGPDPPLPPQKSPRRAPARPLAAPVVPGAARRWLTKGVAPPLRPLTQRRPGGAPAARRRGASRPGSLEPRRRRSPLPRSRTPAPRPARAPKVPARSRVVRGSRGRRSGRPRLAGRGPSQRTPKSSACRFRPAA